MYCPNCKSDVVIAINHFGDRACSRCNATMTIRCHHCAGSGYEHIETMVLGEALVMEPVECCECRGTGYVDVRR
jgi:DnaJ-class molecular chaperone